MHWSYSEDGQMSEPTALIEPPLPGTDKSSDLALAKTRPVSQGPAADTLAGIGLTVTLLGIFGLSIGPVRPSVPYVTLVWYVPLGLFLVVGFVLSLAALLTKRSLRAITAVAIGFLGILPVPLLPFGVYDAYARDRRPLYQQPRYEDVDLFPQYKQFKPPHAETMAPGGDDGAATPAGSERIPENLRLD